MLVLANVDELEWLDGNLAPPGGSNQLILSTAFPCLDVQLILGMLGGISDLS